MFLYQAIGASAQVFNCTSGMLTFIAHPDDDLLFQSVNLVSVPQPKKLQLILHMQPDLQSYISSSSCMTVSVNKNEKNYFIIESIEKDGHDDIW